MTQSEICARLNPLWNSLLGELVGRKVVVLGHIRPDGDCIGSQVALVRFLKAKGVDAVAVNHHEYRVIVSPLLEIPHFFVIRKKVFLMDRMRLQ
ncbi:MAG: DHH family phosphoesterase [Verrucomicrobia bacterium]|nr:DHH family phosphoesterase [Verrucomicrobiota bacterium]